MDHKDNIWIGGNGRNDAHILKFTRQGKFLAQYGIPGAPLDSNSTEYFGRVAKITVDAEDNEAYVADGYTHRRVAVLDADSGAVKRYWGAYGNTPSDENIGRYNPEEPPAQQFRNPVHCAEPTRDGLVYVCDRANDRIQVFKKDGTFVKEKFIAPKTLGDGSVWDIAFSPDPEQTLYLSCRWQERAGLHHGSAKPRDSDHLGDGGRQPGQFFGVHSIAVDLQGQHLHHGNLRG